MAFPDSGPTGPSEPSPTGQRAPADARHDDQTTGEYAERLTVPWWWWLGAVALAGVLAAEVWLGAAGPQSWLPFAVLLPVAVAGLWWLGRLRVSITGGEFRVDDAHLPARFVADAVPIDADGRREVLGPGAHPLAFVIQRPWIPGAVQVLLDDPADPTPYWVISSRRPIELATALMTARAAARTGRDAPPPAPK